MLTRLIEDMKLINHKMRTTASMINKYTTVKNFLGFLEVSKLNGKITSRETKKGTGNKNLAKKREEK